MLIYARNFGNVAKEALKRTTQWVVYYFYKFKVLVSCTRTCHDPVGHTGIQMLSPVHHHPSKRPFKVERMDEEQNFKNGIRISRYKPSGLRDLSRDRAIKEPYWGPLAFVHDMQIRIRSIKV